MITKSNLILKFDDKPEIILVLISDTDMDLGCVKCKFINEKSNLILKCDYDKLSRYVGKIDYYRSACSKISDVISDYLNKEYEITCSDRIYDMKFSSLYITKYIIKYLRE